jgi:hypothetical protein
MGEKSDETAAKQVLAHGLQALPELQALILVGLGASQGDTAALWMARQMPALSMCRHLVYVAHVPLLDWIRRKEPSFRRYIRLVPNDALVRLPWLALSLEQCGTSLPGPVWQHLLQAAVLVAMPDRKVDRVSAHFEGQMS